MKGERVRVMGLDHVSVTAADLDRSIWFYSEVLGIPVSARGNDDGKQLTEVVGMPGASIRWADLDLGGGHILELLEFVNPQGEPVEKVLWDPGAGHIGLRVDDIDNVRARLRDAAIQVRSEPVTLEEPGPWFDVRVLYAIDPDGTWVELVERPSARPTD